MEDMLPTNKLALLDNDDFTEREHQNKTVHYLKGRSFVSSLALESSLFS